MHGKAMIMRWCVTLVAALAATSAYAQQWDPKPNRDVDAGGDKTKVPIVFVHGASGSGEQYERQAMHYTSNGYPPTWVVAVDRSTGGGGGGGRGARGATPTPTEGAAPAAAQAAATPAPAAQAAPAAQQPPAGQAAPARGARGARGGGAARDPNAPPSRDVAALDKFIDDVRARTGHAKVNLVGHSAGTALSAQYLASPERAAKINKYVSSGGGAVNNPNGVQCLAVSGVGDNGRGPSASNGGKVAWMPDYQDHVMVATSDESFWAQYTFFNSTYPTKEGEREVIEKPTTMKITPEAEPLVGGFVKSYIINTPLEGAKVNVWEVAKETGKRTGSAPLISFTADKDGRWGPFKANPKQHYEFEILEKGLLKPRHVYREPFQHTNLLVYFRIGSTQPGYSPSPLDEAPKFMTDTNSVFMVRHQNGAFLPGITSLTVNGTEMVVGPMFPKSTSGRQAPTVVCYLCDGNQNGKSDMAVIQDSAFRKPFSTSCDMAIPADPNKSVEFKLNNRVLNIPAWKSSEAGHVEVRFDDYH